MLVEMYHDEAMKQRRNKSWKVILHFGNSIVYLLHLSRMFAFITKLYVILHNTNNTHAYPTHTLERAKRHELVKRINGTSDSFIIFTSYTIFISIFFTSPPMNIYFIREDVFLGVIKILCLSMVACVLKQKLNFTYVRLTT